jgi:hypothetical protein
MGQLKALSAAALLTCAAAPVLADTIASTGSYVEQANGARLPVSARTDFNNPLWEAGDPLNTAEHELFHAIGFTTGYTNFRAHDFTQGGQRNFRANADGTGTILAVLMATSNHTDPNAGVVNGRDQANDIMQPDQVAGQRLAAWDAQILDAAYAWTGRNLNITPTFIGTWNASQRQYITDAIAAARTLFGSDGTGSNFAWTVSLVPAPSGLLPLGVGLVFAARRRR